MQIPNAIGLAPLLQSPRERRIINIHLGEVLLSNSADYTFHICWGESGHRIFVASGQEPQFKQVVDGFERQPYSTQTIELVRDMLSKL
jgi:hypothetical protein